MIRPRLRNWRKDVIVPPNSEAGRATRLALEQFATRVAFLVAGFGMAAWAPLVPYAKQRLGIDDAALGLLLLCLGGGSIITMPFSGALATRFGCRRVIRAGGLCVAAALPALAAAPTVPAIAVALLAFGAGI